MKRELRILIYKILNYKKNYSDIPSNYSDEILEEDMIFVGLIGMIDPIRKEALTSIAECHSAGIKVLMITGDHPLTAFKIAKDLELTKDYDDFMDDWEGNMPDGSDAEDYWENW